jgi:hypothetical protein
MPPLAQGSWHPVTVGIAQDIWEEGRLSPRFIEVTLAFRPSDSNAEPDYAQAPYLEALRLFDRRWWLFDSTVDAQLLADGREVGPCQSLLYGDGPLRLRFRVPDAATEALQLVLSRHSFVPEAFRAHTEISGPGAVVHIGPLAFAFERVEPVKYPFRYQDEIPDFRRALGHNYRYSRPWPAVDQGLKLLFRLTAHADPDLVPYWLDQVTLTTGGRQVAATHAILAHSTETGAAWLGLFTPMAPTSLPDTFTLDIVGEHLIVSEEVSDESVFDLPMPALPR